MPVFHTHILPSGESASFHKVADLRWNAGDADAMITIRSWETKAAHDASAPISWANVIPVPADALAAPMLQSIETWLVSDDGVLAGGSILNASTDLEEVRAVRWWEIKRQRDAAIDGGFMVAGVGTFDSNLNSRTLVTGAVTLAQMAVAQGQLYSVDWTLADNTVVTLDAAGIMGVGVALGTHIAAWHAAGRTARLAIEAAETADAAAAVQLIAP